MKTNKISAMLLSAAIACTPVLSSAAQIVASAEEAAPAAQAQAVPVAVDNSALVVAAEETSTEPTTTATEPVAEQKVDDPKSGAAVIKDKAVNENGVVSNAMVQGMSLSLSDGKNADGIQLGPDDKAAIVVNSDAWKAAYANNPNFNPYDDIYKFRVPNTNQGKMLYTPNPRWFINTPAPAIKTDSGNSATITWDPVPMADGYRYSIRTWVMQPDADGASYAFDWTQGARDNTGAKSVDPVATKEYTMEEIKYSWIDPLTGKEVQKYVPRTTIKSQYKIKLNDAGDGKYERNGDAVKVNEKGDPLIDYELKDGNKQLIETVPLPAGVNKGTANENYVYTKFDPIFRVKEGITLNAKYQEQDNVISQGYKSGVWREFNVSDKNLVTGYCYDLENPSVSVSADVPVRIEIMIQAFRIDNTTGNIYNLSDVSQPRVVDLNWVAGESWEGYAGMPDQYEDEIFRAEYHTLEEPKPGKYKVIWKNVTMPVTQALVDKINAKTNRTAAEQAILNRIADGKKQTELDQLTVQLTNLESKLNSQKADEKEDAAYKALVADLDAKKADKKAADEALTKAKTAQTAADSALKVLTDQETTLNAKKDKLNDQISAEQKTILENNDKTDDASKAILEDAQKRLDGFKVELEEVTKQLNTVANDKTKAQAEADKAAADEKDAEAAAKTAQDAVDAAQKKVDNFKSSDLTSLEKQIADLKAEIKTKTAAVPNGGAIYDNITGYYMVPAQPIDDPKNKDLKIYNIKEVYYATFENYEEEFDLTNFDPNAKPETFDVSNTLKTSGDEGARRWNQNTSANQAKIDDNSRIKQAYDQWKNTALGIITEWNNAHKENVEKAWRIAYKECIKAYAQSEFVNNKGYSMRYGLLDLDRNGTPELIVSFSSKADKNSYVVIDFQADRAKLRTVHDRYGTEWYYEDVLGGCARRGRCFKLDNLAPIDDWTPAADDTDPLATTTSGSSSSSASSSAGSSSSSSSSSSASGTAAPQTGDAGVAGLVAAAAAAVAGLFGSVAARRKKD